MFCRIMLCFYGKNAFGLNSFITLMDSPALLSAGGGFETLPASGKTRSRQHPLREYLAFVPPLAGQALPVHSCLDPQPGLCGCMALSCLLPALTTSPSLACFLPLSLHTPCLLQQDLLLHHSPSSSPPQLLSIFGL